MIMNALVFGNALKEQKHYEDRVATTLFDDIQKITSTKSEDHVIMNGNISYAPSIRQAIRRYRILRSLVSINFRTDRDDGAYIHNKLRYYGLDKPRPCKDVSLNALCKKNCIISRTPGSFDSKLYIPGSNRNVFATSPKCNAIVRTRMTNEIAQVAHSMEISHDPTCLGCRKSQRPGDRKSP
jgi:hypothetical protein